MLDPATCVAPLLACMLGQAHLAAWFRAMRSGGCQPAPGARGPAAGGDAGQGADHLGWAGAGQRHLQLSIIARVSVSGTDLSLHDGPHLSRCADGKRGKTCMALKRELFSSKWTLCQDSI